MLKSYLTSMKRAGGGIWFVLKTEKNFKIQSIAALAVIVLSFAVGLSKWEWIVIVLLIGMVLSLELINSTVEKVVDIIHPRFHGQVKVIKDILAGAVLIAATIAAIIGVIIFWPYLFE